MAATIQQSKERWGDDDVEDIEQCEDVQETTNEQEEQKTIKMDGQVVIDCLHKQKNVSVNVLSLLTKLNTNVVDDLIKDFQATRLVSASAGNHPRRYRLTFEGRKLVSVDNTKQRDTSNDGYTTIRRNRPEKQQRPHRFIDKKKQEQERAQLFTERKDSLYAVLRNNDKNSKFQVEEIVDDFLSLVDFDATHKYIHALLFSLQEDGLVSSESGDNNIMHWSVCD